jgi:hypothetical protein
MEGTRLREVFPDRYRPTEEQLAQLWEEGLFAFDANVVLNLYRYSEKARAELLAVIQALGERAWLPHQAAEEFLKRRLDVMHARRRDYQDLCSAVEKARMELARSMDDLHRDSVVEAEDLLDGVRGALDGLVKHLKTQEAALPRESNAPEEDAVWREVEAVFGERIGKPYEPRRLEEIFEEGRGRYQKRIPPGYEDARKDRGGKAENGEGHRRFGDLVLWKQTLDKAKETSLPVVLVTDDRKEDWWWISHGKTVGPRPELIEEMRSWAGVAFYMYRPESLLVEAGKRNLIGESASAGTLDEIQDLGSLEESLPARKSQLDLLRVLAAEEWGERGVEKLEAVAGKPLSRLSRMDADEWIDALTEDHTGEGLDSSSVCMSEISYPELRRAGVPLSGYTDRLLDDLRGRSFERQKNAVDAFRNATRKGELSALPGPLQEELGRALVTAAEGAGGFGSFRAQDLLGRIRSSPGGWPERFVAGLLSGALVDEGGRFEPKTGHWTRRSRPQSPIPTPTRLCRVSRARWRDRGPGRDMWLLPTMASTTKSKT